MIATRLEQWMRRHQAALPWQDVDRAADPADLHIICDNLAARAGWLTPPRILLGPAPAKLIGPAAAALPALRALLAFPSLLELPAVHRVGTLAHEMGHLLAGHRPLWLAMPGALLAAALAALMAPLVLGWAGLVLTVTAPAAVWWAARARLHRQEREADNLAVALVGADIVLNTYADETVPMPWRQSWRRWIRGYPTWRPWLREHAENAGMELKVTIPSEQARAAT